MRTRRTIYRCGLVSLTLLATLAGCESRSAPAATPADATYTVRAEVTRLPPAPGGEIYLRHESIPEFRNSKGEQVGMMSMSMPFTAPAELDLSGIAAGARVEATFEVRWSAPRSPLRVVRLQPLAPGTRLEFDEDAEEDGAAEPEAQPAGETPR